MPKARLLLADDHKLLLDGLCNLLNAEFDIVETVNDGRAAVCAFQRLRPDLMVVDIGLPLLNGIEVARQVKRIASSARILFCTVHTDRIYIEEAFQAGAAGYVLKQASSRDLIAGIKTVLLGGRYISPQLSAGLDTMAIESASHPTKLFGGELTPKQREVLQLVAEGKSVKQMAHALGISVRTVEFHKNHVMRRLGLYSTAELTRYAVEQRITPAFA